MMIMMNNEIIKIKDKRSPFKKMKKFIYPKKINKVFINNNLNIQLLIK